MVAICMIPLPHAKRPSLNNSGKMPYFAGLNIALFTDIANSATHNIIGTRSVNATSANAMMEHSSTRDHTITRFLLNRSESAPNTPGNSTNGSPNTIFAKCVVIAV